MKLIKVFIMTLLTLPLLCYSTTRDHILDPLKKNERFYLWEEQDVPGFDEVIFSWGAARPTTGGYLIQVSIKLDDWSPWVDYAYWGADKQYTFDSVTLDGKIKVYQDTIEVNGEKQGVGCRVRLMADGEVTFDEFHSLHFSATDRSQYSLGCGELSGRESQLLSVPGISQMALEDDRRMRICSPTSTTAVIQYLLRSTQLSPLSFSDGAVDTAFDIYGNWALNTAHAASILGKRWSCFPVRLSSFEQVLNQLEMNYPVVVSIKGNIPGGALPYQSGHLLVVTGYDAERQQVCCMDPAFETNDRTHVRYELDSFLEAWERRRGLAYIFQERDPIAFNTLLMK